MEPEMHLFGKVALYPGDCLKIMAQFKDNSIDAACCDPPYHLTSIVQRFGKDGAAPARDGTDGRFKRLSTGFMGQSWDGGDIAFRPETWREVYRVLKPGAHLVAFGGTRSYHRMACAIEDAGFEIRDSLMWLYGTGFPKSHDVSKGIDKQAGAERKVIEVIEAAVGFDTEGQGGGGWSAGEIVITEPATDAAKEWKGWGTALKPGYEPIVLARKPLGEKTVAANVLEWRTGAVNIDGCRIPTAETIEATRNVALGSSSGSIYGAAKTPGVYVQNANGRWPANVVHDGSSEVIDMFPNATRGHAPNNEGSIRTNQIFGEDNAPRTFHPGFTDSGSAARFFYSAKASKADRAGSKHPTVKPVSLLRWLVRLVTPPGGTVLDPFAGTGTTGEAAWQECFKAVLCEAEPKYQDDIRRRMQMAAMGPEERARYEIKLRDGDDQDSGPLFSEAA